MLDKAFHIKTLSCFVYLTNISVIFVVMETIIF